MARPTDEFISIELRKCRQDFAYFCSTYVTIQHPKLGFIKFNLYDYQERIFKDFQDERFNIIKKPRQMGLSTLVSIYVLWSAMFNPAKEIMIISIGARESKEFLKHIKVAHDRLPQWLGGSLEQDNKSTMVFDNHSRIQSIPSPRYAARSFSASLLVIDEAAFIQNIHSLWTSAFPILSTGGKSIVLSTVNGTFGTGQWFYEKWNEAKLRKNNFNPVDLVYTEHPEYRLPGWAEAQRKDLGELKFAQEVLGDFLGGTNTFIARAIINRYLDIDGNGQHKLTKDPIEQRLQGQLWIWEKPDPQSFYVMGADAGKEGTGISNSAFHVFNVATGEQVAEFCGKIDTITYAKHMNDVGKEYGNAFVVLETNNMGLAVMNELYLNLKYPNVYFRKTGAPGWDTNLRTRPFIIQAIEQIFTKELLKVLSIRTINELQTFVADVETGKISKQRGSTDDLLISLGLTFLGIQSAVMNNPAMAALYGKLREESLLDVNQFVELKEEYAGVPKGARGIITGNTADSLTAFVSFQNLGVYAVRKDKLQPLKSFNEYDIIRWALKEDPYTVKVKMEEGKEVTEDIRWLLG